MRVILYQALKWLKRGVDLAFDITDVVFSLFLGVLSGHKFDTDPN